MQWQRIPDFGSKYFAICFFSKWQTIPHPHPFYPTLTSLDCAVNNKIEAFFLLQWVPARSSHFARKPNSSLPCTCPPAASDGCPYRCCRHSCHSHRGPIWAILTIGGTPTGTPKPTPCAVRRSPSSSAHAPGAAHLHTACLPRWADTPPSSLCCQFCQLSQLCSPTSNRSLCYLPDQSNQTTAVPVLCLR